MPPIRAALLLVSFVALQAAAAAAPLAVSFGDFSAASLRANPALDLQGSVYVDNSTSTLVLSGPSPYLAGLVVVEVPLNRTDGANFTTRAHVQLSDCFPQCGDGFAFLLTSKPLLGSSGSGLGIGAPSVAVLFRTNQGSPTTVDVSVINEQSIVIARTSVAYNGAIAPNVANFFIFIDYGFNTVQVFLNLFESSKPASPIVTANGVALTYTTYFVGFSTGTGYTVERARVLSWSFTQSYSTSPQPTVRPTPSPRASPTSVPSPRPTSVPSATPPLILQYYDFSPYWLGINPTLSLNGSGAQYDNVVRLHSSQPSQIGNALVSGAPFRISGGRNFFVNAHVRLSNCTGLSCGYGFAYAMQTSLGISSNSSTFGVLTPALQITFRTQAGQANRVVSEIRTDNFGALLSSVTFSYANASRPYTANFYISIAYDSPTQQLKVFVNTTSPVYFGQPLHSVVWNYAYSNYFVGWTGSTSASGVQVADLAQWYLTQL